MIKKHNVSKHLLTLHEGMNAQLLQSCPILRDPMDCSPRGSSINGIIQVRILEWVAIFFFRRFSQHRDCTHVSYVVGGFFTAESPEKPLLKFHIYIKSSWNQDYR